MTEYIAFSHHKGGTGKTTSCINVAGFLSKMGKDVLVADLDPQGNATAGLGIDKNTLESSMYDVMVDNSEIKDIVLDSESGIHIAPANLDLMGAELFLYRKNRRTGVFRKKIQEVQDHYDYVLIDTPPGSGLFLINGVAASDYVIVPIDPSVFSVESIETLKTIFGDIEKHMGFSVDPWMAVLTRCNRPSIFSRLLGKTDPVSQTEDVLDEMFDNVYTVPYSVEIYESQQEGLPLSHYSPDSESGEIYKNISKNIITR